MPAFRLARLAGSSSRMVACPPSRSSSFERKAPKWTIPAGVDRYQDRSTTPISIRTLAFYGSRLTTQRIITSANFVRDELSVRLAHRVADLARLPYCVATNCKMAEVYELYCDAFLRLDQFPPIETISQNDEFCQLIRNTLTAHLPIIPKLALAMLEVQDDCSQSEIDFLMATLLRSRISRRVIAEQHLALTDTFNKPSNRPSRQMPSSGFVGEIFINCNAWDVVEGCAKRTAELMEATYGPDRPLPTVIIDGDRDASFSFILSHLEYIVGEMLRNSFQAYVRTRSPGDHTPAAPIVVTISDSGNELAIRISDQAGGVDPAELPFIFSFSRSPSWRLKHRNLHQVPALAATMNELELPDGHGSSTKTLQSEVLNHSSLVSLTSRSPNICLGIGIGIARTYVDYWAGRLELESIEGFGTDVFLSFNKISNQNQDITRRASIDAL